MRVWGAVAALIAALMAAAPAGASVARVQQRPPILDPHGMEVAPAGATLEYLASAGESNAVSIARGPSGLLVTDAGANVQAQTGCTQIDRHSARCAAGDADVRTGDGDDRVVFHAEFGRFSLGAGADTLSADLGASSTVSAGSGNDTVSAHGDLSGGEG